MAAPRTPAKKTAAPIHRKSLKELREAPVNLPERPVELCLAQGLLGRIEALENERDDVLQATQKTPRRQSSGPPNTSGIEKQIEGLLDEMRENTGTLIVRAVESGEWRTWAIEHPARDADEPGGALDRRIGYSAVNVDDLINEMERWAYSWNGEPLEPGEFEEVILPRAANGDLLELCRQVVLLHEGPGAVPKSRGTSSTSRKTSGD